MYNHCLGGRVTDTLDSSFFYSNTGNRGGVFSLTICIKNFEMLNVVAYKYICWSEESLISYQEVYDRVME